MEILNTQLNFYLVLNKFSMGKKGNKQKNTRIYETEL